ncbi:MAG: HD domain-containing protein [Magnetococcales bacterium]|nr:HD domain-containing protein [Magnetococcales bacterium]MBF0156111.1 HD domain-containing protein [Magnetococcales bacterium]
MINNLILLVDDEPINLRAVGEALKEEYPLIFARNGEEALNRAQQNPALIVLDVLMPGMDGFEVCRRLKADPKTAEIPVIFMTQLDGGGSETTGFEAGGVDFLTKPIRPALVRARVATHIALRNHILALESLASNRTQEIVDRLVRASRFKDDDSSVHVVRMASYAAVIAAEAGLPPERCDLLRRAAPMHDIGKLGIPDSILLKPGSLSESEWQQMRRHALLGAEILAGSESELLQTAASIANHHHERWDGSGYPNALKGEAIPLEGRIVAIADVFDALTMKRPFKDPWPFDKAKAEILAGRGSQFDPGLVDLFDTCFPRIQRVANHFAGLNNVVTDFSSVSRELIRGALL